MLIHPDDAALVLFEPADLTGAPAHPLLGRYADALRTVVAWAEEYLCRPHPELGRTGNVCPFAQGALDRQTFRLAVLPGVPDGPDAVSETLIAYRDWFAALCRADELAASYQTIVVVFPDLAPGDVPRIIDSTQDRLKPEYVGRGLMIGEFHDGPPDKAGLWNSGFRPLRCPVPLLAIREMVSTDFPFLADDAESVAAYLNRFGDRVPRPLRDDVRAAVNHFGLNTDADAEPSGPTLPVTPGQRRLWFLNQLDPGNPVHHVALGLRLTGELDSERLATAVADVVAAHPVLASTLAERAGEPAVVRQPVSGPALSYADLRDRPAADRDADALRVARTEARRPFDLRRGPLFRARLFRLAEDDRLLLLTAHRLVVDDRSLEVLARSIAARYDGRPAPTPAPDPSGGSMPEPDPEAEQFWARRLKGAPGLLNLPADRPRPVGQSYRGGTVRGRLPADLGRRLGELVAGDAEPAVLAAFAAVLSRQSGQPDVLLGRATDLRRAGNPEQVGPLANSVVLRSHVDEEASFRQLAAELAATLTEALAHRRAPFEEVVDRLDVERGLDRSPVFQVAAAVRRPAAPVAFGTAAGEHVPIPVGTTPVDLTLILKPRTDGGLDLALDYALDLFDEPTIRRLAGHLRTLLAAGVEQPDLPLRCLGMLTAAELRAMTTDWQGATMALPDPGTAWTLIEPWVRRTPDAIAVTGAELSLTYSELAARAAALAHVLRRCGVGRQQPVGLCLERSPDLVAAMLGVWLAGAAYLPLDPGFPPERLRYMLADAGAELVVTDRVARGRTGDLTSSVPLVLCLDEDADVLAAAGTDLPPEVPAADELAYLIHTSGSTGRPKGVQITHRSVANLLAAFGTRLGLSPADRWLAVTTLSFDISVLELLLPLSSGATTVVATGAEAGDGQALRARAEAAAATVLQATPSSWRMLLAAGAIPDRIRTRLVGGEVVPRDLADRLGADGAAVWNVYGPTETTVWSAAGPIAPSPAPIVIGPPIDNTDVFVLDPHGQPVPVGVTGDVFIGGAGLARGYHDRPDLTAQRFVPARFAERAGQRLYATGDRGAWRPDGRIAFHGRDDDQVKLRGFRIELGEIEAALRRDPAVSDAAVNPWTLADDDVRLVAYLAVQGDSDDGLWPRLQAGLRDLLPDYMVPSTARILDALPLTPNGKVDRAALPAPNWSAADAMAPREPESAVERALAGLWREILQVDPIGVDEDFFALGGHSLLGARLLARVRAYFGIDIPTRSLFDAPTVALMAAALQRLEAEPGQAEAVADARLRIEAMTPDEVATMLAEGGPS